MMATGSRALPGGVSLLGSAGLPLAAAVAGGAAGKRITGKGGVAKAMAKSKGKSNASGKRRGR
jgi:hypothetical protein